MTWHFDDFWVDRLARLGTIILLSASAVVGRITLSRFGINGITSETELASVALVCGVGLTVFMWTKGTCRRKPPGSILILVAGLLLLAGSVAIVDYLADRPIALDRIWDLVRISLAIVCLGIVIENERHLLVLTLAVVSLAILLSTASYVLWIYDRTIVVSGISWTRILIFAMAMSIAYLYQKTSAIWAIVCAVLTFFLFSTSMKVAILGVLMILLCATIISFTNSWLKPLALLFLALAVGYAGSLFSGDFSNISSRFAVSAGTTALNSAGTTALNSAGTTALNSAGTTALNSAGTTALNDFDLSSISADLHRICNSQSGNVQYCLFPYVNDTTERMRLWGRGIDLLLSHPKTGVGTKGYEQVLIYYYGPQAVAYEYRHPHNLILDVGTLHGIFALGIFTCLLFAALVILLKGNQTSRYAVGYLSGAAAILLMAMFGGDVYDARYLFYFAALAAIGSKLNDIKQ